MPSADLDELNAYAKRMTADPASKWQFLLRFRYQATLGALIAVVLPVLLFGIYFDLPLDSPEMFNTGVGSLLALMSGYVSTRRLQIFPGIAAGGYVFMSFSVAYAALATGLILLRLDFSRVLFLLSWILTVSYYTYIHLRFVARTRMVLGVIPGGATNRLPNVERVTWYPISESGERTPRFAGVVADLSTDHSPAWDSRITSFVLEGVPVYHVKEAIEQLTGRVEIDHLSENTLGSLNPNDFYLKAKGMGDAVIALVALILLMPVIMIVATVIRLDSPGSALFRQQRTGFRGRPFTVYKFRTMRTGSATRESDERVSAMTRPNDPRITRFGAFLRKTRLDELPQLINIMKGEMSLIGPRPEAIPLTRWYEQEIPFYHYRHIIKPGVTGWAQVNQGHVTDINDVREKLNLDFYYVKNFSFWLDILIVLRTAKTVVTGSGAK